MKRADWNALDEAARFLHLRSWQRAEILHGDLHGFPNGKPRRDAFGNAADGVFQAPGAGGCKQCEQENQAPAHAWA